MPSVLFVCTGNICRSPMAEAIARRMADDRGLAVDVDSAGTSAEERGNPPDPRAGQELQARGYLVPARTARQVRLEDFREFDWLIAMTRGHLTALERQAPPGAKAKVVLFSQYLNEPASPDIADPWFGGQADFVAVMDQLEAGMPSLLDALSSSP